MKPSEILRDLKKFPSKILGQNFLVDDSAIEAMLEAAQLSMEDTVVEIGPGLGALTFPLLTRVNRVIAIEQDRELANYLYLKKVKKLTVVTGDALKVDWTVAIPGVYKIVANIPYSITFPLLRKIFSLDRPPTLVALLIQKEAADRLIAPPGSSERGLPTVRTEANARAKVVKRVPSGSFYPGRRVDASIIVFELMPSRDAEVFWPAVEAGFRHKRQTLANGLNKDLKIPKSMLAEFIATIGQKEKCRAQELTFEDWVALSKLLTSVE